MSSKLLILSNNIRGLVKFRIEVIKRLLDDGCEVYVSAPYDKVVVSLTQMGCTYIKTNFSRKGKNPFKDIILIYKYLKIINNLNPSIVLTYTIKPNLYGGLVCRLTKHIQIANITGLGSAFQSKNSLQTFVICLYKLCLKHTQFVYFQNNSNKDFCLRKGLVSSQYSMLPGSGVNTDIFRYFEYPTDLSIINFLYIGRIMKQKGIEDYLEAAQFIKSKYPYVDFSIIGSFEELKYKKIIQKMGNEGIINYYGRVDNVIKFLNNAHCVIVPSCYPEGMSNVILESCSIGRPVITTDIAGCCDAVDEGKNGYIFKNGDKNDLIEKIMVFITLPIEKKVEMSIYARKKMEKEFNRKIVVESYSNTIKQLLY